MFYKLQRTIKELGDNVTIYCTFSQGTDVSPNYSNVSHRCIFHFYVCRWVRMKIIKRDHCRLSLNRDVLNLSVQWTNCGHPQKLRWYFEVLNPCKPLTQRKEASYLLKVLTPLNSMVAIWDTCSIFGKPTMWIDFCIIL